MGRKLPALSPRDPHWEPGCETARSLVAPRVREGVSAIPQIDPDAFRHWNPETQQRAIDLLRSREASTYRPFYCPNPQCDGDPHDDWEWRHARAKQRPPSFAEDWLTWLLQAGRGAGKTRVGAELTHRMTSVVSRIALIGPTGPDIRDTMVEGISGILATAAPDKIPEWEPSKKKLTWPNGAIAFGFSGEEPDRLRGPQHGFLWIDEPAHIDLINDVWDMALLGLRLGKSPRVCATTTPIPTKWMKELVSDPLTRVSRFSTYDNLPNLADTFKRVVLGRYEGTRMGKQELHGEILDDVEGALWKVAMLEGGWVDDDKLPQFDRIVVGVDPAGTANKKSDETGIIVVGIAGLNIYVLSDRSGRYSPSGWANAVKNAYEEFSADAVVPEKNYGGDMVTHTLENSGIRARILPVVSRRGKAIRAEPIVALYEKEPKRMFHVRGLETLEDEMLSWVPGKGDSPNRVDALVHGVTELARIAMPSEVADPVKLLRHLRSVS